MMKRSFLLSCLLVTMICNHAFSQSRTEIRNSFYEAESWILFEAYKDALPLYQQLLILYPDNSNFKYRIGQCYINMPGEKEKAVTYLEEAVRNINPKYREGKFREKGAPYDALYYLANAYRINNQLDKALATYSRFKMNLNTEVYDTNIVNLQILSCMNARELMEKPKYIKLENLGNKINENTSEFNPVVSDDENMIVFSKSEPFYDAILYSVRTNGVWSDPVNMNEILKVDRDLFPTSLSADSKTLYLYSSADYDGIIYSSRYENGTWTPLSRLNDNINTKYWESHATISHDNSKLYFTSNRKGTYGGLDIYVSSRDSTGDWGPAVNLGAVINSPYNEESPFLSSDDKTLFYSSRGHFNMGGYDIFSSKMNEKGEWSTPVNIGYPLNSTDDDVFFKPAAKGDKGYYSMISPGGSGKQDIYHLEIFSDDHPRNFLVRGTARVEDLLPKYRDSIKISIGDIKRPDHKRVVYTDPATAEYSFNLSQGEYQIGYEGYGGEKVTKDLALPITYPSDIVELGNIIIPRKDYVSDLFYEGSDTIIVTSGDSILLAIEVEPKSSLLAENWSGDSIVRSSVYEINTPRFNYSIAPRQGNNRVIFRLTDRFNNNSSAEIFIRRDRHRTSTAVVRPEQGQVIARKQTAAYLELLKKHADESMARLIKDSEAGKREFGKPDDLLSYLRSEADKNNIDPEKVNILALKVAVTDNVLTQAAVNLLAIHATGEMKEILSDLNIHEKNLKTWTDLQRYISEISGGRLTAQDLNDLASRILAGTESGQVISKAKDEMPDISKQAPDKTAGSNLWILWILAGALLIFLFIIFFRRRKKKKED